MPEPERRQEDLHRSELVRRLVALNVGEIVVLALLVAAEIRVLCG